MLLLPKIRPSDLRPWTRALATNVSTYRELQISAARKFAESGNDTAALDARVLLCHAASVPHESLVANADHEVAEQTEKKFDAVVVRRLPGEPVARILGEKEFWGLTFQLNGDTLVPRPDSEAIVVAALDRVEQNAAPLRVLDLGTGSGCLLLALLSELPNASGVGIDTSTSALEAARANAAELGLGARAEFHQGDWCAGLEEHFDIIVSNPPYIPTKEIDALAIEVRNHDPAMALDGGADGMDCYKQILAGLPALMAETSIIILETSPDLYAELFDLVKANGRFADLEEIKDLAGRSRGLRFGNGDLSI